MSESNVININGKEHDFSEMNDGQKYLIGQIQDLQKRSAQLRFSLDQVAVAQDVFFAKLVESLEEVEVAEEVA